MRKFAILMAFLLSVFAYGCTQENQTEPNVTQPEPSPQNQPVEDDSNDSDAGNETEQP